MLLDLSLSARLDCAWPCKALHSRPAGVSGWRPARIAQGGAIPEITAGDVTPLVPGLDLWDCWPLARPDGATAEVGGRHWWFFLSAPHFADPVERHGHARIRLLSRGGDGWRDHGNALPDGLNPGSREWAGSAVLEEDGATVTLYFTAAGQRGEATPTFSQRIFATTARMTPEGPQGWSEPDEILRADGLRYALADEEVEPGPGLLKAFRDPFFFRDPRTGAAHLVFSASAGWSDHSHGGMAGIATHGADGWRLDDPLVEAVGVNNELERAQVHFRDGRYYLFWSTQAHTFAPDAVAGPNGLYGMVADRLEGPWRPLNGSGLVAANPAHEPRQAYSWVVTGEDKVWSFVDLWGLAGRDPDRDPALLRDRFGGTVAPPFRLVFAGDRVTIAG